MRRASLAIAALAAVQVAAAQTRPHNFDLLDVKWSVSLNNDDATLTGDVTNTLRPVKTASSINLDFGTLTVDSITIDGKKGAYTPVEGGLKIVLSAPADGKHAYAIRIKYHGHPGAGVYFVPASRAFPAKTPVVYTQGEMVDNRFWLPTYDYPDDKATSEGTIDVPAGWFALSNGKMISDKTTGGRTAYHWKMDQAHATYLISFVAGPYDKGHEEWDGIPVDHYAPQGLADQGDAAFGGTADIVRFYSKLTGFRYPYAKYSQAAVPDYMFGGMENITCTTQTINALHPKSVEPIADTLGLVAHELAHQWFGDTVTCSGWSDAWINEGWATFLPNFYVREKRGQEQYDIGRYGCFQGGLDAHHGAPNRPVVWRDYKDALDMFNNFIYPGGASRMFMLMHQVGEDRFWKATSEYLNERKYTSFNTEAFFDTYSKNLGIDLKPFMKQWFFTNGAPNLTVTADGSNLVVTQAKPYFDVDLPVWVLDGSTWRKYQMHLSDEKTTLDLGSMAGKPVLADPECWLMADIKSNVKLSVQDRIALFNAAPNAAEQCRIMDSMLGDLSSEEALSFAQSIRSEALLERYLGRLADGSQDFLLSLSQRPNRGLANSALARLAGLPVKDNVVVRLKEIIATDPNDALKETATRSLLFLTNDQSLAEKVWKTEGFQDGYRQIALDWWMKTSQRQCREHALEALSGGFPEPTRVHAIGLLGRLKDLPSNRTVFNALAAVLKETSFGARNTAINALAEYGDKAAIPLLKPFLTEQLVFFRQSSKGAIDRLSAR